MATLERQAVRAEVNIGDKIIIETPDVISFNVSKRRGQMAATFSASLKVPYDFMISSKEVLVDKITISAGVKDRLKTIFTGAIYQAVINPIRTDASKVMLNISGSDVLSILEGQHVNRRVKTWKDGDTPPERWGIINNIVKEHTPLSKRFPIKLYTPLDVAVYELKNIHIIRTPDAFKTGNDVVRTGNREVRGGIEVDIVVQQEGL